MKRYHVPPMADLQHLMASFDDDEFQLPPGRIALAQARLLAQDAALRFDLALTEYDCNLLRGLRIAVQG